MLNWRLAIGVFEYRMKKVLILFIFIFLSKLGYGQFVTLNDSLESFGGQVAALLENTKNVEAAIFGQEFDALWPASFSATQQKQIAEIAIYIQERKMPSIPYHRDFFGALTLCVNVAGVSGSKMDNLLNMLSQSLEYNSNRNFARELVNLRIFFEHNALHRSGFNSLYALNADFDFEYIGVAVAPTFEEKLIDESKKKQQDTEPEEDGWGDEDDGWGSEDSWGNDTDEQWSESKDPWEDDAKGWAVDEDEDVTESGILSFDALGAVNLPPKEGAVIHFTGVDLIFATGYDSTGIMGTSGTFLLDNYLFVGEGGKFDWSSAGKSPDELYATLQTYSFNTRNPYIEAGNVSLAYPEMLDKEVKGFFEFKSVKHDSIVEIRYPKFISYDSNVKLRNIGDANLIYTGGMAIEGNKILGASTYGRESSLEYKDEEGRKFRIVSKLYDFGDSVITAHNSKVAIYQGRDSITHPSVKARYYTNTKRFAAIKDKNGYNLRPFNASLYNMSIEADAIDWDLNSDSLNISILNARSLLPAYFKSAEYYDAEEIKELTGVYNFNPLLVAYSYGAEMKSREFYVSNLIADTKLNEKAVKGAMLHLLYLDFIEYDETGGRIYLKDKALHFVRSKNNKKDFDDLIIPSLSVNGPNATLHLDSDELTVRGIDKFYISEILDVYIFPKNNEIRLLRNRDFKFDGQLFAGNFEFAGRNFTFRYDSFLIDLVNIDSIKFYIDGEGLYEKRQVDNKLVSLEASGDESINLATNNSTSGTLYINRPDNKSGRKIFPQYPIFDADRGAIVYFDEESTLGGAYDKSVYFIVPPFAIDSLSSSDPATIGFEGTFVTGGILPEFKQRLKIMPDNSLGFEHVLPQEGFELYGGPGRIYNQVTLDKNGIVGSGKIDYLSSSSYSDKYIFYLDSMLAEGTNFKLKQGDLNGISYPDIYADNYEMTWMPEQDHMYVRNKLDSFKLYNNTAYFDGEIDLGKTGVYGSGKMATRGFESQSDEFTFSEYDLIAKHSIFKLESDNPEKPLLAGDDIRLEFDFSRDVADISPEIEGMAALNFPYAQIKTSISKAQWNLQEQKVYMTKPPDVDIENSYFYATRKELDSLAFNAEAAEYDLQTSQLKVSGIPYIIVADAMITPENNEVLILENAQIGELYNTTIVIDTLNEYHRLINGTIQIHSRVNFSGDATYQFVNTLKDTFNIKFGKFDLWQDENLRNDPLQTVASGIINENDRLRISEGMFYKGDVTMYARNKALELEGYVQFDFKSRSDYNTWVRYSSMDEETQDVMFNFNTAVTEDGNSLNAGLHFGTMNEELYATFAEEKKLDSDEDFFTADGIVSFNAEKNMFMVEDTTKTNGGKFSGKIFGYDDSTGAIEFEGPLNFVESTENATLTASGFGGGNINDGRYQVNSLLKFEYKLPEPALTIMAADLFEVLENFGAPEAENDPDAFLYKVSELIGERATQEYDKRNQESYLPIAAFTPKMAGTMVFSKAMMKWSPEHRAWYSDDKVGLSNILKYDINALIDGFIEIKRSSERGTIMNIFIQASSDCWYFFGFEDNRLMIYSSNDQFVDAIATKSNINKAGFGEYVFVDAGLQDVLKFVDRFRLNYLGITEPFEITMPVEEVSEVLDLLQIPVDNTEDGGVLEIPEDNTDNLDVLEIPVDNTEDLDILEIPVDNSENPDVPDTPVDSTEDAGIQPQEVEEKTEEKPEVPEEPVAEPMTEEDLLKPADKKVEEEEEDDEGF